MSRKRTGFSARSLYRYRKPHLFSVAREKLSFTVAIFTVTAFVLGNMVGQHGLYAFWHMVLGEESDTLIVFDGMVTPVELVPDYRRWAEYGGSAEEHTYSSVPRDLLVPLPAYRASEMKNLENIPYETRSLAQLTYSMGHLSSYESGDDNSGSHNGVDIRVPVGTPIRSVANGVIQKVSVQNGGFGTYILVRYPNVLDSAADDGTSTYFATYAHLSAALVREGQIVTKGELIARSGKTGFASGPHLHFQIDSETAPYHPYWPFTSTEASSAKMSFVQAVNAGLNQNQAVLYSKSPILLVQSFQGYRGSALATNGNAALNGVVASGTSSSSALRSAAPVSRSRVATRQSLASSRTSRLISRSASAKSRTRATATTATIQSIVAQGTIPSTAISGTVGNETNTVAQIELTHSGKVESGWQKVTLRAVDRYGQLVKNVNFDGKLYIRPEFGDAEIRPDVLTAAEFRQGIATVDVLARGQKTVYFVTRGAFETESAPMVAGR
ncbi:MAG: M23 family metallopeptidase [Candidatus Peribacteraceae bacterium]